MFNSVEGLECTELAIWVKVAAHGTDATELVSIISIIRPNCNIMTFQKFGILDPWSQMQPMSNLNDAHHILIGSVTGVREVALGTLSTVYFKCNRNECAKTSFLVMLDLMYGNGAVNRN